MKYNKTQVSVALVEIGAAFDRLQRAGLNESQARVVIQKMIGVPVSALDDCSPEEKMWTEGEPSGDESADAVKESLDASDDAPDTEREPATVRTTGTTSMDDEDEESPDTVRESTNWDKFMGGILLSEGRRANAKIANLPDSPGMLHAKRYGEKAHNRIVIKK